MMNIRAFTSRSEVIFTDYNYHTHSWFCDHASGAPEEYVLRAIECGIKYLGVSDHVPLRFEDGSESSYRVPMDRAEDYMKTFRDLGRKYKDKLEISVGFEAEYYPEYFAETLERVKRLGADYLILGQHFIMPENVWKSLKTDELDRAQLLRKHVSLVVEAIKTGKFTYVAHPDNFRYTNDDGIYEEEMTKLCEAALACDVPLEINFLGIRTNRHYPNPFFWEIAGRVGAPVTFGFDAHDVRSAYDGESLETALEMVEKYGLNYIGRPKIKAI